MQPPAHAHANERKLNLALLAKFKARDGLIFKGNSKNYLTEIQSPFKD